MKITGSNVSKVPDALGGLYFTKIKPTKCTYKPSNCYASIEKGNAINLSRVDVNSIAKCMLARQLSSP